MFRNAPGRNPKSGILNDAMEISSLIFLSSGLFLGWSLGANDAANVFGSAVGSRMIRFKTAAIICGVFLVLGAVFGGAGAAHGLGELGAVNALPGSFMVAFSAALTVYWMTKAGVPVSTTQAIVGAIIGWNLFSGSITDTRAVAKIAATWVACPILGAVFAATIYVIVSALVRTSKLHLLRLDLYTRAGLVLAGAFGAYALGANNIANVMGVFVSSSPFTDLHVQGLFTFTSVQQLFLLGAIAIAVGVFTYSKSVMMTVGKSLMPLNPVAAWVVVVSHSIVLFLFSSTELEHLLVGAGLPAIPLIPVSSSQAVIGAVVGVGLLKGAKGARQIRWRVLFGIASGWVTTPIMAAILCFVTLFFLQNVFGQQVYREVRYVLSRPVLERLDDAGVPTAGLHTLTGKKIAKGVEFRDIVRGCASLTKSQENFVIASAEIHPIRIDPDKLAKFDATLLTPSRIAALVQLTGQSFAHKWQFHDALAEKGAVWKKRKAATLNNVYNKSLEEHLEYVCRVFHVPE